MNGDAESAEVLQYSMESSGDGVRVRGVVRNISAERLSPVEITVELVDSAGQVIEKKKGYPGNSSDFAMAPGQKAGFNVEFATLPGVATLALVSVYTELATDQDDMPRTYQDLEVADVQLSDGKLTGKVRNSGQQQASDLLVSVVLYDRKSRVLGLGLADLAADTLAPAAETTFSFSGGDGNTETWDVAASGRGEE